jgi:hypothetical protein
MLIGLGFLDYFIVLKALCFAAYITACMCVRIDKQSIIRNQALLSDCHSLRLAVALMKPTSADNSQVKYLCHDVATVAMVAPNDRRQRVNATVVTC